MWGGMAPIMVEFKSTGAPVGGLAEEGSGKARSHTRIPSPQLHPTINTRVMVDPGNRGAGRTWRMEGKPQPLEGALQEVGELVAQNRSAFALQYPPLAALKSGARW